MNLQNINFLTGFLKVAFLVAILMSSFLIAQTSVLINEPLIASAITFDLIITLPFAYWFFIRKTKISKLTIFILITIGFVITSLILPENNRQLLEFLKYFALPVFEIGVVSYVIFLIYKSQKTFKTLRENKPDFLERFRQMMTAEFSDGLIAKALTFELSGIYYAFFSWKKRNSKYSFTSYKENGFVAIVAVLGFILAIEIFVLHFLMSKWNELIAWILTASSIYLLFQIFAHFKAVLLRSTEVRDDKLFIRCGLFGDAEIEIDNIETIEITLSPEKLERNEEKLVPLGEFTESNVKISVVNETVVNSFYGRKKNFQTLYFYLDEAEKLKSEIEKNKGKNKWQNTN